MVGCTRQSGAVAGRSGAAWRSGAEAWRVGAEAWWSGGLVERERQRSFGEQQSFWVHKAKQSSGLAERRLGGAEQRLGGAGEAAELLWSGRAFGCSPYSDSRFTFSTQ